MVYLALMSKPKKQNSEEKKRINRKQWIATAHEAIAAQRLQIVQSKAPHKAFNDKEIFFVQECTYSNGDHVIVKVSAPDIRDRITLKKEAYWCRRIQQLVTEAKEKGITIPIHFPEVVDVFTYKEQAGIITRYIIDDWVGFKGLSKEEREDIIIKIIDSMQNLPIPEEELVQPSDKRLIPVITAEDYPKRARQYLGELVASKYITKFDKNKIVSLMEKNVAVINSFPLKLNHGDFHTGNFRYSKDPQTGDDIITLFDLELITIQNSFSMVAAVANLFDLVALANVHPGRDKYPEVFGGVPLFSTLFSVPQMIHRLEKRFVMNNKRRKDAELVYRLMRIDDCYVRLADAVYEAQSSREELNDVEVDSYREILLQQLHHCLAKD